MSKNQFYRSKLILSALKEQHGEILNENTSRLPSSVSSKQMHEQNIAYNPQTLTTPSSNALHSNFSLTDIPCNNLSLTNLTDITPLVTEDAPFNIYDNPIPCSFQQSNGSVEEFIENISDISNLLDSDDSVADPSFSIEKYLNIKTRYIEENSESDDDTNCNPPISNNIPALPCNVPQHSVFIATYPNSLIFTNQKPAASHIQTTHTKTVNFIANYPEPIYINTALNCNSNNSRVINNDSDGNDQQEASVNLARANIEKKRITRNKAKYVFIQNGCGNKCKRDCNLFTVDERKVIWNNYWNMNYDLRRQFLNKCIAIKNIQRRTINNDNPDSNFKKNETRFFFLQKNNTDVQVCRKFLLNTLGYKNDSVITELSKAIKRKPLYQNVKENRGGKKPKIARNDVEAHILSYNPAVSHYRRSNAPNIRYLPRTLTVDKMFSDFKTKNPNFKLCKEIYRQTLKTMKISFKYPKGDKCVDCGLYEERLKVNEGADIPEDVKIAYENHKAKASKAIQKYQEDASLENTSSVRYYSMDLQKVMMLPDMPKFKESFFLSRMITFNLTFAPIRKKTNVNSICVLWHEAYSGRDANDIVNAIAAMIEKERDINHLILWCDNCTAQNKNWILFTSLVTIINSGFCNLESLTLKYLTKGHTHMSADGVHGNIERQIKKQDAVYDFEDYKNVILGCRSNIEVIEVQKSYEWVKKKRIPRRNDDLDPMNNFLLSSVVEVKFVNGSRNMFYKNDYFESHYSELDFLMKKHNPLTMPTLKNIPRGIKESKKEGIVRTLLQLMPMNRREFWQSLPINNNSVDLVSGGQLLISE